MWDDKTRTLTSLLLAPGLCATSSCLSSLPLLSFPFLSFLLASPALGVELRDAKMRPLASLLPAPKWGTLALFSFYHTVFS